MFPGMDQLKDKVAVVTGAASGIGLAMTRRFLAAGMKVVMADIEQPALEAAKAGLDADSSKVLALPTDVSSAEQMDRLGAATLEHFGGVHVVCNNAGVPGKTGPMWKLTPNDWKWVLDVNVWGVIHGVRVFGPRLVEQDEGHFVNTASVAGLSSLPGLGPYNVSKHGVVTLSETLLGDLRSAKSAVGVSVLCPGVVATQIHKGGRNRPDALTDAGSKPGGLGGTSADAIDAFIAQGLSPDRVAEQVHDAILANQFYILTHVDLNPLIKRRIDRLSKAMDDIA